MKILMFLIVVFVQFNSTQIVSIVLIGLLFALSFFQLVMNKNGLRKKALWMLFLWSLMILMMIRSSYFYLSETKIEVFWLSLGCVSFSIIASGNRIERISIIKSIILSGVFGALLNIILHSMNLFSSQIINVPYAGTRWVGGFDGPNEFGGFYVMITALVLGLYLEKEYTFFQMLIRLSILIPVVYFSFSRGALLGLISLIAIFSVYSLLKAKRKLLLLTFYTLITYGFYSMYLQQLLTNFGSVRKNASERSYITTGVLNLFQQRPILGHGIGSFGEISTARNTTPHNDYFLFLVSGGIAGVCVLLYFYSKSTMIAFKNKFYPEFLMLLVFMTQSLTFNNLVRGRLSILFWVVIILTYLGSKTKSNVNTTKKKRRLFKRYKLTW